MRSPICRRTANLPANARAVAVNVTVTPVNDDPKRAFEVATQAIEDTSPEHLLAERGQRERLRREL